MKRILSCVIFMMTVTFASAQSSVGIQINHFLQGERFENNVNSTNNLGNDFMLDRLQYYLSGFSITHDGGQVTELPDLYVLVSLLESSESTVIDMGDFDIQSLEAISFHLGVDEVANHADPALLDEDHPLYFQTPSMHWGWAGGYRFIALEGLSGPDIDKELQFHCIGNQFHKKMTYEVNRSDESSYLIELDAEYADLLHDIDVSNGVIIHGEVDEIRTLATNFRENVFTAVSTTNTENSEQIESLEVYPNPTIDGLVNIEVQVASGHNSMIIKDALGKTVFKGATSDQKQVQLPQTGMYFLSILDERGNVLGTRKVIAQ